MSDTVRVRAIDAWAQPADAAAWAHLPEVSDLFRKSGAAEILNRGVDPEAIVAAMDAADIETLMLAAWRRPGQEVICNERIHELTARFPGRFVGVATVDLHKPVEAVRELRRCVKEWGFKALRIVPWLWKLPPNDRHYYPLFVECVELGIPFCTQVGHTGPLMPSETGRPIPYLDEVALTFPELTIVAGHIGYPWTDEMLGLAWKHARVYIDTSAYLPRYYPPQLLHAANTFLSDKILFGTNFPQLALGKCRDQADQLPLSEENKRKFFRDNALHVFGLTG